MVTETENEFVVSSEYMGFLNSSVLVARAVLVSTQPCSVEGMRIDVSASIKEPTTGIIISYYFTSLKPSHPSFFFGLQEREKKTGSKLLLYLKLYWVQTMKCILFI